MENKIVKKKRRTNLTPEERRKRNNMLSAKSRGNGTPQKKDIYIAFQDWYSSTDEAKAEMGIKNMTQFAEHHHVSIDTLSDWKKRKDFDAKVFQKSKAWGKERWPNVLEGLYKRATKGYAFEVELFAMITFGWTREKAKEEALANPFTENDLMAIAQFLPEEKRKVFYDTIATTMAEARLLRDRARDEETV